MTWKHLPEKQRHPATLFFLFHIFVEEIVCSLLLLNTSLGVFWVSVSVLFSASGEFPKCHEKIFMHFYPWDFIYLNQTGTSFDIQWILLFSWPIGVTKTTIFRHRSRPKTAHNLLRLTWNAVVNMGRLESAYAVARSYTWQWHLAYIHLKTWCYIDCMPITL